MSGHLDKQSELDGRIRTFEIRMDNFEKKGSPVYGAKKESEEIGSRESQTKQLLDLMVEFENLHNKLYKIAHDPYSRYYVKSNICNAEDHAKKCIFEIQLQLNQ